MREKRLSFRGPGDSIFYGTKVVACLVDLIPVGVREIPFRHQVMSDDIHQDPRYHMSLYLVSLIIVNPDRSCAGPGYHMARPPRYEQER